MKSRVFIYLPLMLILMLFGFLGYALLFAPDPTEVPSALTNKPLPEFELVALDQPGQILTDQDIVGKPMLLNVWATWCGACKYEHPFLNSLAAQQVMIVGLNYKDEQQKAIQWLAEYANPYHINLFDPEGELGFDLGVTGAPETFFIDGLGRIQYRFQGPITDTIWQQKLKAIYEAL